MHLKWRCVCFVKNLLAPRGLVSQLVVVDGFAQHASTGSDKNQVLASDSKNEDPHHMRV